MLALLRDESGCGGPLREACWFERRKWPGLLYQTATKPWGRFLTDCDGVGLSDCDYEIYVVGATGLEPVTSCV
jgi:hypothetical protein